MLTSVFPPFSFFPQHVFRPLHPFLGKILLHFEVVLRPIYSFLHQYSLPPGAPPAAALQVAMGARLHYFWCQDRVWSPSQYSQAVGSMMYLLSGNAGICAKKTRALQSFICETHVSPIQSDHAVPSPPGSCLSSD